MIRYITLLAASVLVLTLSSTVLARRDEVVVPSPYKIQAAQTAEDIGAIAKAYERKAAELKEMADQHRKLAQAYSQPDAKPWMAALVQHCNSVAEKLEEAAREELALADGHAKAAK